MLAGMQVGRRCTTLDLASPQASAAHEHGTPARKLCCMADALPRLLRPHLLPRAVRHICPNCFATSSRFCRHRACSPGSVATNLASGRFQHFPDIPVLLCGQW
jgi:hypothetical protein